MVVVGIWLPGYHSDTLFRSGNSEYDLGVKSNEERGRREGRAGKGR